MSNRTGLFIWETIFSIEEEGLSSTDSEAINYNPDAIFDDWDSCVYGSEDCSGECGGADISCWELDLNLTGEWNFSGNYEYDNLDCSGEGYLDEDWECDENGEDYISEEECIANCPSSCYLHQDAPSTIILNDDGTGGFLIVTDAECSDDSDCIFEEEYECLEDYNNYPTLDECQANCQVECELIGDSEFNDQATCNDSNMCEIVFSMLWGEYNGEWCYY